MPILMTIHHRLAAVLDKENDVQARALTAKRTEERRSGHQDSGLVGETKMEKLDPNAYLR